MNSDNNLNKMRGLRLKECREQKNITQEKLGSETGYSVQTISYVENGKRRMSTDSARIWGNYLGVRMEYLLCEDNDMTVDEVFSKKHIYTYCENGITDIFTEHDYLPMSVESDVICKRINPHNGQEESIVTIEKHIILTPDDEYIVCSGEEFTDMIKEISDFALYKIQRLVKNSRQATESEIDYFNNTFDFDPFEEDKE